MIKSFLIASTIAGALTTPAMAGGLESHYVGGGVVIDPDGTDTSISIGGRYNLPKAPVSLRGNVTIGKDFGAGAAVTADFGIGKDVNIFGGGGVAFGSDTPLNAGDDTVGFALVGIEAAIHQKAVVFADLSVGLGGETTYIPKVGIAYRF